MALPDSQHCQRLGETEGAAEAPALALALASLGLDGEAAAQFFPAAFRHTLEAAEFLTPREVASGLLAAALAPALAETAEVLGVLGRRAGVVSSFAQATDAIGALRALCLAPSCPLAVLLQLLEVVVDVPRSALSESDDLGLHQVALSLLLEPRLSPVLDAARSARDGEACIGKCRGVSSGGVPLKVDRAVSPELPEGGSGSRPKLRSNAGARGPDSDDSWHSTCALHL